MISHIFQVSGRAPELSFLKVACFLPLHIQVQFVSVYTVYTMPMQEVLYATVILYNTLLGFIHKEWQNILMYLKILQMSFIFIRYVSMYHCFMQACSLFLIFIIFNQIHKTLFVLVSVILIQVFTSNKRKISRSAHFITNCNFILTLILLPSCLST